MTGSDSNTDIHEEFITAHTTRGLKVVEVEWVDSYGVHGWGNKDERLRESHEKMGDNVSVGYLFLDTPEWIGVAESISHLYNLGCTMVIPKACVRKLTILREGPTP